MRTSPGACSSTSASSCTRRSPESAGQPPERLEELVDIGFGREVIHDPGAEPGGAPEAGRREPALARGLEIRLQSILVGVEVLWPDAGRQVSEGHDRQLRDRRERFEIVECGAARREVGGKIVIRLDEPAEATRPE